MLILLRTSTAFILGEPIDRIYHGGEVYKDMHGTPRITVGDDQDVFFGSCTDPDLENLEWKEVEKD